MWCGTLLVMILLILSPVYSVRADTEPDFSVERGLFLVAESALRDGDDQTYQTTREALDHYPLVQYLDYRFLTRDLRAADPNAIARFLQDYPDGYLARTLRNRYLDYLGKEKKWSDYLFFAGDPDLLSTERQCFYRRSLLQTGQRIAAVAGVESLWLHGQPRPNACDPLFDAWRSENGLTSELAWQRFELAIDSDQLGLARYLCRYLSESDRIWADRWLELEGNPEHVTRVGFTADAHRSAGTMLERAFVRMVPRNLDAAVSAWETHGRRLRLSDESGHRIQNAIALRLALRGRDEALPFMARMPDAAFDDTLRQWQLRAALRARDWQAVITATQGMDGDVSEQASAHYWRGRALEQLGQSDAAEAAYRIAATERNFYGFLAADRLGQSYRIGHEPLAIPADILEKVANQPAILRMRELVLLERYSEARQEWSHIIDKFPPQEQEAAAHLFARWGWHDRAIFTVARAGSWGDIDLRFPLAFIDLIAAGARRQGIDPAWAMAVARQESAFLHDVRSSAGALGIMQIMPATGRSIASAVGIRILSDRDILDPENNARMGTYYLRRNLDNFGGHSLLSTAAYNAGAHRVRSWLPDSGAMDPDIWAELIPFRETRDYVQRVFAYRIIYAVRLGMPPMSLSSLLYPVTPQAQLAQARHDHLARLSVANPQPAVRGFCDAPGYTLKRCLPPSPH